VINGGRTTLASADHADVAYGEQWSADQGESRAVAGFDELSVRHNSEPTAEKTFDVSAP
jgi:hypothetical protein